MSVSTSSYFSNSIVGVPQVAGELVDIYGRSSTPKFAIGTKFERQDGAIFRYSQFAGVTSAGMIMASVGSDTGVAMVTSAAVAPSATYQMPNENPGLYPGAVGSRYFICCGSAAGAAISLATANVYAGAYITISSGSGVGNTYRIKGHTATGTPATGLTRFELYDQILVAMHTNVTISIVGCKFANLGPLDILSSKGAAVPAGVVPIIQAANYYGWVQTRGMAGVLLDSTAVLGSAGTTISITTASLSGAGSIYAHITTSATNGLTISPLIGILASASCASCVGMVDLRIE
jgi:hypothetical protein